jgi:hypothetical protein
VVKFNLNSSTYRLPEARRVLQFELNIQTGRSTLVSCDFTSADDDHSFTSEGFPENLTSQDFSCRKLGFWVNRLLLTQLPTEFRSSGTYSWELVHSATHL